MGFFCSASNAKCLLGITLSIVCLFVCHNLLLLLPIMGSTTYNLAKLWTINYEFMYRNLVVPRPLSNISNSLSLSFCLKTGIHIYVYYCSTPSGRAGPTGGGRPDRPDRQTSCWGDGWPGGHLCRHHFHYCHNTYVPSVLQHPLGESRPRRWRETRQTNLLLGRRQQVTRWPLMSAPL